MSAKKATSCTSIPQQEIAQRLGVSQMTVSRVVNNRSGVGKKLRAKILKEIRKSGYVLDNIAAGLRGVGTKIVGLIIPDVSNSFFPEITTAIETIARENGYWVTLAHSHEDYTLECEAIDMLRGFRVEGFIIAPSGGQNDVDIYQTLDKMGTPYVFIDRLKSKLNCNSVVTDTCHGALELGNYLVFKGYRKWGYLTGPKGLCNSSQHSRGLKQSIKSIGSDIEIFSVTAGLEEKDGYQAAGKLLEKFSPDVIIGFNDPVALGTYKYLEERKIKIPRDVALCGFSDLKSSRLLEVPLTTVSEETTEMGSRAFEILKNLIENPNSEIQNIKLKPTLQKRKSA